MTQPPSANGNVNVPLMNQTMTANIESMSWEQTRPGIQIKRLFDDKETGMSTILFKMAPGTKTPWHEHTGIEQVLVLEGGLKDHDGDYPAGTFIWRVPGSVHQAEAPNGSLHLAFFTKKNRLIDDDGDHV
jgi:anti-sigma factor ChrR (cupin superfamily)